MGTFGVSAGAETLEFADKVMDMYFQKGDKKEDTLLRILKVAEAQSIKETHPEIKGTLVAIDETIKALIEQINGIVAGQDSHIANLKEKLDVAIEEKRTALETAKAQADAAQAKVDYADTTLRQAEEVVEQAKQQAADAIGAVKKEASYEIERANTARDQALRERDDARTIAAEKTAHNDLLIRQMADMESSVNAHKDLQGKFEELKSENANLRQQITEMQAESGKAEAEKKLAIANAVRDAELTIARLQAQIEILERH